MEKITKDVAAYCACMKLRIASRKVTRLYDAAFRPSGITPTQFTLLTAVNEKDDVSLTSLADILGLERTTLLRNLKPLERDGLILLSTSDNSRTRIVKLSSRGFTKLEQVLPLWREAQATLENLLGPDVWQQMQSDLTKIGNLT